MCESEDCFGIILAVVFFFLYGLQFLGWLIAIVGAAAVRNFVFF